MDQLSDYESPGVSLVEELCLLAVEDDGGVLPAAGEPAFGMGVIGACLVELSLRGRLDAEVRIADGSDDVPSTVILVVDTAPVGEPALDAILSAVAEGPERTVIDWARILFEQSGEIVQLALAQLRERGVIEVRDSRFLWVLSSRRYPVIDGSELREAKLRIMDVLIGGAVPSPHDSVLIGLASIAGLLGGFLGTKELRRLDERIQEVSSLDLIARGIEDSIRTLIEIRAQAFMISA